jgi:exoenzyme U
MGETLERDTWVTRVLGVAINRPPSSATNGKRVKFAPVPKTMTRPPRSGPGIGRNRSNDLVPPPRTLPPEEFNRPGGKPEDRLVITKRANGTIAFTSPPPPVREITFSGGGGKGVALAGAVKALEETGQLKTATKITGASVGSMTAALVAAGITAEEFTTTAGAKSTTDRITEDTGGSKLKIGLGALASLVGGNNALTGQGLEDVVRDVLDETLRTRMSEYLDQCSKDNKPPAPAVVKVMKNLAGNKAGPTFGDLRELSKVIPAIKEVVITGTYTTEFEDVTDKKGKAKKKELKNGNQEGQLYVFDADSEPDMEVALAVHASASFPVVFKPVDITLSSGLTVRFIDGGVMNNTPTSSSIGNERKLDPMPQSRGMTFVFDDEDGTAEGMLAGKVTPPSGRGTRFADWFLGADNSAGEYSKNRDVADRPEELIVVPLTIEVPKKKILGIFKTSAMKTVDMRGTLDGTLEFNASPEVAEGLQKKLEDATKAQVARESKPKTREFDSDSQMFVSVSIADLKLLADGNYEGAADALQFREQVKTQIGELASLVKIEGEKDNGTAVNVLNGRDGKAALAELEQLAGSDLEYQAYVGREMNRGGIDTLLDAIRKGGVKSKVTDAGLEVAEVLRVQTFADNILKQLVYPKMKTEPKGGAGIETLLDMQTRLRRAQAAKQVNDALTIGINHFKNKSDKSIPKRGHKQFARELARRMM